MEFETMLSISLIVTGMALISFAIQNYCQHEKIIRLERRVSLLLQSVDSFAIEEQMATNRIKDLEQNKLDLIKELISLGHNPFSKNNEATNEQQH